MPPNFSYVDFWGSLPQLYDNNSSIMQASESAIAIAALTRYHIAAPEKVQFIVVRSIKGCFERGKIFFEAGR